MEERVENVNDVSKKSPSLFGMIMRPAEQFEKIKHNPKIWIPMFIITVIFILGTLFLTQALDLNKLLDTGMSAGQEELVKTFTLIVMVITGVLSPIVSILIKSAILLAVAKIANSKVSFKQIFSLNTYIYLIPAIGLFVNGLIRLLIGGNAEVYVTSLAGLLNSDSTILAVFEIFTIWGMVLLAIGLNKVANLSKGLSWTLVVLFFLFQLGMAFIGSLFTGISGM